MKGIKQVLMGFIVWYNHRYDSNVDIMDSVRFIRQLKPDELRNSETDKEYCDDNYDYSNCLIHNNNRFGCLSCTGDKQYEVKKLNEPGVIPRFIVGTTVKTIVSKNNDKIYRQERRGTIGVVEKIGTSLNKICYWVNFGDHYSWIDESDLNVV